MNVTYVVIGIVIYLAFALFVAFLARRGDMSDMSGYFIGGRKMGGIISALSYSATTFSAFMLVGLAGLTYQGGVGALGFEIVYITGVSLVALFGPRFWHVGKKYGYVTPSEMIGDRFENRNAAVVIALVSCLFLIPYSAVQLAGIGYLLQGITNNAISFTAGVIIATVIAVLFSYIAGIHSVMWTDALQALIMIISATAVVLVVIHQLGGFSEFFYNLETNYAEMLSVPGNGYFNFLTFLGLTIPWFFFSLSNPQVSQRLFMPASLKDLRVMLLGFLVFAVVYTFVSIIWGFSAIQMFPDLETPDLATPMLLSSGIIPTILGIIVMVGIFVAAVSTIDSILLTLSSMFARDVYGNMGKERTDAQQLKVGKVVIPMIAVLAFLFAKLELNLIAVLSVAASAGLIVTVPSFFGAFFWKRGTAAGVISSVTIGALFVLILEFTGSKPFGLWPGIWGIITSTVLFVVVSLLTKAPEQKADEFIGYVKAQLNK